MKKIYDAVHGFIHFNEIEQKLIDSAPFQRLHFLHQLGIAFLVYPGATHTRFEHSLGTMEISTKIFESLLEKYKGVPPVSPDYQRQILRLAALCHDLGHLPFSHVAEKALLGAGGHEEWTLNIIQSDALKSVFSLVEEAFPGHDVVSDVIKMAIGKEHLEKMNAGFVFSPWEEVMAEVITGDFFGADRIDYLLRDAQCTGVAYGLFDYQQLIEMLCILKTNKGEKLGIEENGISSCEALLLARYFMHKRVYQHSSVKAYTFHLSRFMKRFYEKGSYLNDLESYLLLTDNEILSAVRASRGDPDAAALLKSKDRFSVIQVAKNVLEELLKLKLLIPEEAMFCTQKVLKSQEFSFPVKLGTGAIVPAEECSQVKIPWDSLHFIYVDAAYESQVKEALLK